MLSTGEGDPKDPPIHGEDPEAQRGRRPPLAAGEGTQGTQRRDRGGTPTPTLIFLLKKVVEFPYHTVRPRKR